jgi:ATP-dependent DNA ligase
MKEIYPMLAHSGKPEWGNPNWVCEEKIDGSRYILQFDSNGVAKLTSRKISVKTKVHVDKTENLRDYLFKDLKKLAGCTFDGEIVSDGGFGDTVSVMGSDPEKAKAKLKAGNNIRYIVYDMLDYYGVNIRMQPFWYRRDKLKEVLKTINFKHWELVKTLPNKELSFLKVVRDGGEGVILKATGSYYFEDTRSHDWIKVKKTDTYDGVIIGMNEGEGKYKGTLGALVIGQYKDGELVEVATISGMTDDERKMFWNEDVRYLTKVVEFEAQEKTDGRYRHPRFVRMRKDKSEHECVY